ncbi:MAG: bifunctional folylpolyglutamate synthase/dihydrofolate synthase [Lachnospiraceae bacterium]|nr:bifunctional folylpolyglutamate synthase/dihydrofolate synthase [Lachnospiraceae bacterium]
MNYEEAVNYINDIPFFAKSDTRQKSGNENLNFLMEELGAPHKKIKSIHIAGTNGKGSTANFIKCILEEKGYKVGIFTSPHLVDIRERIIVADNMISEEDFLHCFLTVKKAEEKIIGRGKTHISFFEFMFAMATVYFEKKSPDYVIYETGLGGRLDATNLLSPVITVITSIGLDHTKYLGDTVTDIAGEKAGIIKSDTPVVYNTGSDEADLVISKVAKSYNAEAINVAKTDYIINDLSYKSIDFSLSNSYYNYEHILINTNALYQLDNAATAIVTCNRLFGLTGGCYISQEECNKALGHFFWAGRMEFIYPNVCIDGAHNEAAVKRLIESVNKSFESKKKYILFAVAEDKDYKPMIKLLCDGLKPDGIYVTKINSKRAVSAEYIAELFASHINNNCRIKYNDDIGYIFGEACKEVLGYEDRILVCAGSLYLAGEIKQMIMEAQG